MAKRSALPRLSEAQLELMHLVWQLDETTVGEVWKRLAARRRVARNTVLTLMERLVKKGWLQRRADGHVYRYSAAVPRQATLGRIVRRLVDTAFGGSADGLVAALLDERGVTALEAAQIRKLIDKSRRPKS